MKILRVLAVVVFISALAAPAAIAQNYEPIGTEGGVKVMARYNPFGHNNLIVAFLKFENTNAYKVDIDWTPLIKCQGQPLRKGPGSPFSISEKGTYEVTVWRSQACGQETLKSIEVEMTVKKEGW